MRYVPEFDGMRAVAAIAVVAFHTRLPGIPGGFLGVDVFFVLSGYLTATLALSQRDAAAGGRFRSFMLRRLLRIWPLLLCVVVLAAAYMLATGRPVAAEILTAAFFLANITVPALGDPTFLIHTWTLAAEMQFYALVALLAIYAGSVGRFRTIALLLFAGVTLSRVADAAGGNWVMGFYSPLSHTSGLFLGAVLAALPPLAPRLAALLAIPSFAILTLAFAGAEFVTRSALLVWIPVTEMATAGCILGLLPGRGAAAALLRMPAIRQLGVLSYGIYLWHYPIAVLLRDNMAPGAAFATTLSVSIVLAALSYRVVETPIRRLGRNHPAGRSASFDPRMGAGSRPEARNP